MSESSQQVDIADLKSRSDAEVDNLIAGKTQDLRKARFSHALGQLRTTHTLGNLRRDIARLKTALAQRRKQEKAET